MITEDETQFLDPKIYFSKFTEIFNEKIKIYEDLKNYDINFENLPEKFEVDSLKKSRVSFFSVVSSLFKTEKNPDNDQIINDISNALIETFKQLENKNDSFCDKQNTNEDIVNQYLNKSIHKYQLINHIKNCNINETNKKTLNAAMKSDNQTKDANINIDNPTSSNPNVVDHQPQNGNNGPIPHITKHVLETVLKKINDKTTNLALTIKNIDTRINNSIPNFINTIFINQKFRNYLNINFNYDTIQNNRDFKNKLNTEVFNVVRNTTKQSSNKLLTYSEDPNMQYSSKNIPPAESENLNMEDFGILLLVQTISSVIHLLNNNFFTNNKINDNRDNIQKLSAKLNEDLNIQNQSIELYELMSKKLEFEEEKHKLENTVYKINITLSLYQTNKTLYISTINANVSQIDKEPDEVAVVSNNSIRSPSESQSQSSEPTIDSLIDSKIINIDENAKKFQELYDSQDNQESSDTELVDIQGNVEELSIQYNLFLTGNIKLSINFEDISYKTNISNAQGYIINKTNSSNIISKAIQLNLLEDSINEFIINMNGAYYHTNKVEQQMTKQEALNIMKFKNEPNNLNELKKQRNKLALTYHPDKGGKTENFQKLNTAYETLIPLYSGGRRKTSKKSKRRMTKKNQMKKRKTIFNKKQGKKKKTNKNK